MKDKLLQRVKKFVSLHAVSKKPVLLGFSGGPDSLSLLHLLKESSPSLQIHVAHIDHGWREKSALEAEALSRQVSALALPFSSFRAPALNPGNLEAQARVLRLKYFKTLYQELDCQALILGHQADDVAETILKQLLEGSSLFRLSGIKEVSTLEGMQVWRPLVGVRRRELLSYLQRRQLQPLEDETNSDPRFLRARLRTEVLPHLTKHFGKEVVGNLGKLAESAQELQSYLERQIAPYLLQIEGLEGALRLDLAPYLPLDPIEIQGIIRSLSRRAGHTLSREMVEQGTHFVVQKASERQLGPLKIDRGCIQITILSAIYRG